MTALTGAQRGRVARHQLLAGGITGNMIRSLLSGGSLRPEHRGVYIHGAADTVELGRETGALLAIGERAALSHQSAAAIWGLMRVPTDGVHVVVARGESTTSRPGIVVHRSRSLPPQDLTSRYGLPVTTPARTLLDLADDLDSRRLERAFDEALAQRLISPTKIREQLARAAGRRGAARLARLNDPGRASTLTRSQAEERLFQGFRDTGFPMPVVNDPLYGYVADFHWRDAAVVGEVDGYQWHDGAAKFERDHAKANAFRDHGLELISVTARQVEHDLTRQLVRFARAIERGRLRRAA